MIYELIYLTQFKLQGFSDIRSEILAFFSNRALILHPWNTSKGVSGTGTSCEIHVNIIFIYEECKWLSLL